MKWMWLRMIASVTRDLSSITAVRSHKDAVIHSEAGSHTSDPSELNFYVLDMPIDPQVSAICACCPDSANR